MLNRLGLKITYQCSSRCAHCLYGSSKSTRGVMPHEVVEAAIATAKPSECVMFTGGEPTIERARLLGGMDCAHNHGLPSWLLTNGSWGRDPEGASALVREMLGRGLIRVNFSADAYHQEYIPLAWVVNSIRACVRNGVPTVKVAVTYANDDGDHSINEKTHAIETALSAEEGVELDVRSSTSIIGRALTELTELEREVETEGILAAGCKEAARMIESPFHFVGANGQVEICTGFCFPGRVNESPFWEIVSQSTIDANDLLSAFQSDSLSGLMVLAVKTGYVPKSSYLGKCALCFDLRNHLRDLYPNMLTPEHAYGAAQQDARAAALTGATQL